MSVWPGNDLQTQASIGVADAKRRFSELIDRVDARERFVVSRHGRPAVLLSAPTPPALRSSATKPARLAVVCALAEWEGLDEAVAAIYEQRRRSRDRDLPDLG
jgi:prevent-host-death family protein